MFKSGDIVKVLLPNVVNTGYDYRLNAPADLGSFVECRVMNRAYIGVVWGITDSGLPAEKIKSVVRVLDARLSVEDLQWIKRMSEWTLMTPGAVLKLIINIPDAFSPPRYEQMYSFDFNAQIKMTQSRQAIADAFASNENNPMSVSDIINIAHVSSGVVRTMIKNGTLHPVELRAVPDENHFVHKYRDMGNVLLNDEQNAAASKISDAIARGGFSVFLLDGITGSGKTQVYFDSVLRAYNAGKSVLLMMPEIALTAQFISRFTSRFGAAPVVWHSNLTAARRREIWRGVLNGDIRIVVGTRSALFLPWQNLGLIVVDEEHDSSYKQEDMGNYHARDMAILRASITKFPVVLASATPSAETLENVSNGKYIGLKLTSRFGGATLPKIETIDLRENRPTTYRTKNNDDESEIVGALSEPLCNAISETLNNGQQTMLFINRRGFAPIVQCKKCGWIATCSDCSVGMTYHKRIGKLLCHMCGRTEVMPDKCPNCQNEISTRGVGIEKIESEIAARFPKAPTAIVSSDTIASRQSLERIVSKMESGEIDIVIGTQILAKGHHFPNLTLVGVVDSDMGLFGTDFRAAEHTFQQLFQVAGRAGRGAFPGRVLLQTYQPDHPVLQAICAGNRDEFMKSDMDARRVAKMPPYGQLVAVVIEGARENVLQKYCADLSAVAPNIIGGRIMGPVPAQIYQVRNWYRMRFLIAGDVRAKLQPIVAEWIAQIKQPANVRVKIDVNPINFM